MGAVSFIRDRLSNVMSGMGTSVDRRTASQYMFMPLSGAEAEAAYRTSWLARKIIDVPPKDMTRAWRDWQAGKDVIQKLEAEEKRLHLKAKCQRALVLSRLFGGGAIILGTNDADVTQPIAADRIAKGGLAILDAEPEAAFFLEALQSSSRCVMAAPTKFELLMVALGRRREQGKVAADLLLDEYQIDVIDWTNALADVAPKAFRSFGKGRHKAALNFGDCMSYALAKSLDAPLLYKGNDFALTDLRSAA